MSLANMQRRLQHLGGGIPQNRMIIQKLRSMLAATKYSYQAAQFSLWGPDNPPTVVGLFNPVTQNENFDTKMISTENADNSFQVGSYFLWHNTQTYWICFMEDKTELAYFRGECRQCNFMVRWVDENKELMETLIAVIGPSAQQIRTSSSMQAKLAEDFPSANLKVLVQNNPANRRFFHRYQVFIINNIAYQVEQIDELSMPGVIQLMCNEYYSNLIDDDVESGIRNTWNVQPIIPQFPTDYAIQGPLTMKPQFDVVFESIVTGGEWLIIENEGLSLHDKRNPASILGSVHEKTAVVHWDSMKSGNFTIAYRMPSGQLYQKAVVVESLF